MNKFIGLPLHSLLLYLGLLTVLITIYCVDLDLDFASGGKISTTTIKPSNQSMTTHVFSLSTTTPKAIKESAYLSIEVKVVSLGPSSSSFSSFFPPKLTIHCISNHSSPKMRWFFQRKLLEKAIYQESCIFLIGFTITRYE